MTGSGKTTIGRMGPTARLPYADGDDFHDATAIATMRAGRPLTDDDRQPWLGRLNRQLHRWRASDTGGVLACSALTERSRHLLAEGVSGVRLAMLTGDPEVIRDRIAAREGHFAGPELLDSQLATLELPTAREAVVVDVGGTPEESAAAVLEALGPVPPTTG